MLFELCFSKQAKGGCSRQRFPAAGTWGGRGGWPVLGETWQRMCNGALSQDRGDEEAAVIK